MVNDNLSLLASDLSKKGKYKVLKLDGHFDGSKVTTLNTTNKELRFDPGFRVAGTSDALSKFYRKHEVEPHGDSFHPSDNDSKTLNIISPVAKLSDTSKFDSEPGYRMFSDGEIAMSKVKLNVGMIKEHESSLVSGNKKAKVSNLDELIREMSKIGEADDKKKESKSPKRGSNASLKLYLEKATKLFPLEKKGYDVTNYSGYSPSIVTFSWKTNLPKSRFSLGEILGDDKLNRFYFMTSSKNSECDGVCGAANFVNKLQGRIDESVDGRLRSAVSDRLGKGKPTKSKFKSDDNGYIQTKFSVFNGETNTKSPKAKTTKKVVVSAKKTKAAPLEEQEEEVLEAM